jgi:hypothetical protein
LLKLLLFLAIRNVTGHYYLNGNWRIDFPRSLKFAGTSFHYERKPHGFFAPERVSALGPTTEPIYIVVSVTLALFPLKSDFILRTVILNIKFKNKLDYFVIRKS